MTLPSFTQAQLAAGAPGPATALTIGVLDGVHLGHQALLRRLSDEAKKRALSPGVVTLHPHPITVLRPEIAPSYLTSLEDRMQLMRDSGADWVIPSRSPARFPRFQPRSWPPHSSICCE